MKGLGVSHFTEVVEGMPLTKGASEVVAWLKDRGCTVGIISDSYTLATQIIERKLKMDFHIANELTTVGSVIKEKFGCQWAGR